MPEQNRPSTQGSRGRIIRPREGAPHESRWRVAGYALAVVACLLSLTAGTVFGHMYWGSDTFQRMWGRHGASTVWNMMIHRDPTLDWTPEKTFAGQEAVNVLVLGVDYDYDNKNRIVRKGARSDSILLAHVDFAARRISALTIPRDSAVRIPEHRGIHKINAAHALGGPQLAMETISSVFGVQPDYAVVLNVAGFQRLVDAVGGIDLTVHKKLDYDDNWGHLHIHLKPGYQHLDGYQAMGYVRMRHSDSDLMRSQRQHEFLEALREKIKRPATFNVLPGLVDKLNEQLSRVNLSEDQLFTLVNFARQLPRENIDVQTLPSFEGPSYVTIDTEKSADLIQRMFFPHQMVALNIDAPDPNSVRSMNAPYERGSRRHSRTRRHGRSRRSAAATSAPEPRTNVDLSVEPPSDGESGTSQPAAPEAPASGDDAGSSGDASPG